MTVRALSLIELVSTLALVSLLALVGFVAVRPVLDRGDADAASVRLATAVLEARRAASAGTFPADVTVLSVPGVTFAADTAVDDQVGAVRPVPDVLVMVTRAGSGCLAVVYSVTAATRWGQWKDSASCSASTAWSVQGQILGSSKAPAQLA